MKVYAASDVLAAALRDAPHALRQWVGAHEHLAIAVALDEIGAVYATRPHAAQLQYPGTCPYCEQVQMTNGANRLVLHGYRRPGEGYTVGRCLGAGALAVEVSRRDLQARLEGVVDELVVLEHRHATVLADPAYPIPARSGKDRLPDLTPADARYAQARDQYLYTLAREVEGLRQEKVRLTDWVERWTPRPLEGHPRIPEVQWTAEEREARRALARVSMALAAEGFTFETTPSDEERAVLVYDLPDGRTIRIRNRWRRTAEGKRQAPWDVTVLRKMGGEGSEQYNVTAETPAEVTKRALTILRNPPDTVYRVTVRVIHWPKTGSKEVWSRAGDDLTALVEDAIRYVRTLPGMAEQTHMRGGFLEVFWRNFSIKVHNRMANVHEEAHVDAAMVPVDVQNGLSEPNVNWHEYWRSTPPDVLVLSAAAPMEELRFSDRALTAVYAASDVHPTVLRGAVAKLDAVHRARLEAAADVIHGSWGSQIKEALGKM